MCWRYRRPTRRASRRCDSRARSAEADRGGTDPEVKAALRPDLETVQADDDLLKPVCLHIDIWHTMYEHVMASPQGIVEWFKGSSLQPFLSPLDAAAREKFLAAYGEKITGAYKPRVDGKVLLKFPRLFIVAVR